MKSFQSTSHFQKKVSNCGKTAFGKAKKENHEQSLRKLKRI